MTLKACKFSTARAKSEAIGKFLREHADDLPEADIKKSVAVDRLGKWVAYCDEPAKVAAVMRYDPNDWYLCTLKNAAVRPDLRGQGIGTKLYEDTARKALADKGCLVLAADVTTTNQPSIRALRRVGFKEVSRFCWAPGQKPADVMHFVKLPPIGEKC